MADRLDGRNRGAGRGQRPHGGVHVGPLVHDLDGTGRLQRETGGPQHLLDDRGGLAELGGGGLVARRGVLDDGEEVGEEPHALERTPVGDPDLPVPGEHPARLVQRVVASVPDPVEARDHVEGPVGVGELEHVPHPEVALRRAGPGDVDQRRRRVEPADRGPSTGRRGCGEPRPAGHVEVPRAGADAELVEHHVVGRAGVGLEEIGPLGRAGSPTASGLPPVALADPGRGRAVGPGVGLRCVGVRGVGHGSPSVSTNGRAD